MEYRFLGKTGIRVSRLCFGTLAISPIRGLFDKREGIRLLYNAAQKGVNFFDTAELYETYPFIRKLLKRYPDSVIATKSYAYDEKGAKKSLDNALSSIGRDYVDIMLMHEQESRHTVRGHFEALNYYLKMKEKGLIRAVGLSTHYVAGVDAANFYDEIEVIHPIINVNGIGIQGGALAEMEAALTVSAKMGKAVYGMKPLGGGHLICESAHAFRYLLEKDYLYSIAVGMQSVAELDYNIAVFNGDYDAKPLKMDGRKLFIADWCEGCGRCEKACGMNALSIVEGKAVVDHEKCLLCGYCGAKCPELCIKVF